MITYLCIKEPIKGTIEGTCCICGIDTINGYKFPFSSSFTGYSFLTHGDCACPQCYAFIKDRNRRFKSWIATSKETIFLKRLECIQYILAPPDPPFFLYITKSGQKQGWLSALKYVNHSKDLFYISTDWVGHFLVDRIIAHKMNKLVIKLREKKISKTALLTGQYTMYQYRLAIENKYNQFINDAKQYIKNPLWEVLVYIAV